MKRKELILYLTLGFNVVVTGILLISVVKLYASQSAQNKKINSQEIIILKQSSVIACNTSIMRAIIENMAHDHKYSKKIKLKEMTSCFE